MLRLLISMLVILLLVLTACGDSDPQEPDSTDQTAVAAPQSQDDPPQPETTTKTAEETTPEPSVSEQKQEAAPPTDHSPGADLDLDEAQQQIDALITTGDFTQARLLAQEQAAAASDATRQALDEQVASLRRLEQQGHQASAAIELLGGNNVEQRRGRRLLLDGGKAGRILLTQAVREADIDIADEAVTLLVVLDEIDAFPALLERYTRLGEGSEEQEFKEKLHEAMAAMAPRLEADILSSLPDMVRDDTALRHPAIAEVLLLAMERPDGEQSLGADTQTLLSDYVERAHESDDRNLRMWSLNFAQAVGIELFEVRINFQTEDAPVPDGYIADHGVVKQQVGDFVFGWSEDNTGGTRNRSHDDPRYATLNHFNGRAWSIEVPNGRFQITLVTGDPSHTDQRSHLLANNLRLEDEHSDNFMTHEFKLTVTNGKIVIKPDDDARNAKIVYLVIEPAGG